MPDEQHHELDEDDIDLADLTPDELEEWTRDQQDKADQKRLDQFTKMADDTLNRWSEAQPVEVQQAVADAFVETGEIDHNAAGVNEIEAQVVVAAFTQHVERNVLKPLGLASRQFWSYVDEGDYPAFRRAAVKGDWALFHSHAQKVASHIHHHGDTNEGLW